jgi:hypothetical protein
MCRIPVRFQREHFTSAISITLFRAKLLAAACRDKPSAARQPIGVSVLAN